MPARSQAQRAYLNAHFGHAWVKAHHFDNKGKLPARKGKAMKNMHQTHSSHNHLARHGHKAPKKDPMESAEHGRMNKEHGTTHGFAPKPGAHHQGHATDSHMGNNYC